jgi:hypothetical protein
MQCNWLLNLDHPTSLPCCSGAFYTPNMPFSCSSISLNQIRCLHQLAQWPCPSLASVGYCGLMSGCWLPLLPTNYVAVAVHHSKLLLPAPPTASFASFCVKSLTASVSPGLGTAHVHGAGWGVGRTGSIPERFSSLSCCEQHVASTPIVTLLRPSSHAAPGRSLPPLDDLPAWCQERTCQMTLNLKLSVA